MPFEWFDAAFWETIRTLSNDADEVKNNFGVNQKSFDLCTIFLYLRRIGAYGVDWNRFDFWRSSVIRFTQSKSIHGDAFRYFSLKFAIAEHT